MVRYLVSDPNHCFVLSVVSVICCTFLLIIFDLSSTKWSEGARWNGVKIPMKEDSQYTHCLPNLMSNWGESGTGWNLYKWSTPVASSVICQNNFRTSDFQNWGQYRWKFAKRLILYIGTVPGPSGSHPTPGTVVYRSRRCDDGKSVLTNKRRCTVNKLRIARVGIYI